jgi:CheY-like chemotaxis protein
MSVTTQPLVLLADPDAEFVANTRRQLEWAGYDVITTASAAETLELVEERRPDAVVTEAKLIGATGYETVRQIRERPHNRLMPILMVSARAGGLDRKFAFTVGADEYVRKPFPHSQLVSRLSHLAPVAGEGAKAVEPAVSRARMSRRPAAEPVLIRS